MILLWWACTTPTLPRPTAVPADAQALRFVGEQVQLDGKDLIPWRDLSQDHGALPELEDQLGSTGLWMSIPETARWTDARRLLATALKAGPVYLGDLKQPLVVGPYTTQITGQAIASCTDGPLEVLRPHRRLTLEIHNDDGQAWVNATVRFLPVVAQGKSEVVANLFQDTCWAPRPCDAVGAAEASCRSGAPAPATVAVAGPVGCLLPLGKGLIGHASWRTELPDVLTTLGFGPGSDVLVTATEQVPYGAVWSVLSGLQTAKITPVIGTLRMGSRSGPPICTIPTRTEAQLAEAGQAWYGHQLHRANLDSP